MKKYVTTALFIFWVIVTGLFVAGLLFYQNGSKPGGPTTNQPGNGVVLNQAQLAAHSTADSCWLLISGKVYDVSSYLTSHPGGADIIIQYCGTDSTNGFTTKGRSRPRDHSAYAYDLLSNYYIGDFGQTSSQPAASNNATNPNVPPPAAVNQTGTAVTLSAAELAKHNSSADCWLLISGKIYNVTNYLYYHPGGTWTITPYCGADATTGFETKGGRGAHSGYAYSLLGNYLLGSLGQQTTASQIQQVQQPGQAGSQNLLLRGREED